MTNPPVALYRWFDAAGTLLYVGITNNPSRRTDTHANERPWWRRVASATVEWYPNRAAALAAEYTAIKTERPGFNIAHSENPPREGADPDLDRRVEAAIQLLQGIRERLAGTDTGSPERFRSHAEYELLSRVVLADRPLKRQVLTQLSEVGNVLADKPACAYNSDSCNSGDDRHWRVMHGYVPWSS